MTINYTEGFTITPSDTVNVENDPNNHKRVKSVVIHNVDTGATVRVLPANQNAQPGLTLTGTSGTANITVREVAYLATYSSSLTTTATNFVNTHSAALLAVGVTVRSAGAVLVFGGVPSVTVANVSGDLSGTVLAATPVTIYIPQGGTSGIAVKRVYNTTPTPPAGLVGFYPTV